MGDQIGVLEVLSERKGSGKILPGVVTGPKHQSGCFVAFRILSPFARIMHISLPCTRQAFLSVNLSLTQGPTPALVLERDIAGNLFKGAEFFRRTD